MATESDNVNSGALGTLVAVGTCAMLGISLVVTALVRAETAEELANKELSADRPYRDLVAEQTALQNAPAAYTDRAKGLVTLPLERAMELTVAELTKDPNLATPAAAAAVDAGAAPADAAARPAGAAEAAVPGAADAGTPAAPVPGAPAPGAPPPKPAEGAKNAPGQKAGDNTQKKAQDKPVPAPKPAPAPGKKSAPAAPGAKAPAPPTVPAPHNGP